VIKVAGEALAKKSKDLQLAKWLTEGLLRRDGFAGLRAGLQAMAGLLERYWDTLWPELDPDDLELRAGPLDDELRTLAGEGVQSLLLEGGPTLGSAFLRAGLVDKLLVVAAPVLSGAGPVWLDGLDEPLSLVHVESRRVGDDVLIAAYLREP